MKRFVFLILLSALLLCTGCVRSSGYGGYSAPAYPQAGYQQPAYQQPTYAQPTYGQTYGQPAYGQATYPQQATYPSYGQTMQTIPPPATGTIGYGYGTQGYPGYPTTTPTYAPYNTTTPSTGGWQSIAPQSNTGAQVGPRQPSRAMPRNVRPASNLAWQSPSLGSEIAPVTYAAPLTPSYNVPAATSMVSVPTGNVASATATADCGCSGSVIPATTYR